MLKLITESEVQNKILLKIYGNVNSIELLKDKASFQPSIFDVFDSETKAVGQNGAQWLRVLVSETVSVAGLLSFVGDLPIIVEAYYNGEAFLLKHAYNVKENRNDQVKK